MFEIKDLILRPMEVIGDEGYLLVKLIEGVAYDSPVGGDSPVPLTRLMVL